MRTLSRPMFNMGGPIKQGVMHGIREPYKHGTRAALVGNPVYPKTGGREHHMAVKVLQYGIPRVLPHIKRAGSAFKNIFRGTPTGQVPGWSPLTTGQKIKSWFGSAPAGKYLAGSPEGRLLSGGAGWAGTAGKKIGSVLKGAAKSPLTVGAGAWYGVPWAGKKLFGGDDPADPVTGVMKPGGYPKAEKKTKQAQADFAKAQREDRVQKYLKMMGYDRAKKTAIADALIDASKIVSDRGTLDRKNITAELINPIIQATSKRLDKPEQIREAVGLMMTKAGLEKEMYDAKPGTVAKNVQDMVKSGKYTEDEAWAIATKGSQGAVADIQGAIATGKVGAGDWPAFVRSTGAQHGENVEVYTDEQIKEKYKDRDKIPNAMEIIAAEGITDDGIYVLGGETIRIKDGKVTQLR